MLVARPTKYGGGIELFGDTHDLHSLHQTIHSLTSSGPLSYEQEEVIHSLAYEVRHAYQGDRLTEGFGSGDAVIKYYGTQILWPEVIFSASQLRHAAAYSVTQREHQANLFRLEYLIESCLISYDAKIGQEVIGWWQRLPMVPQDFLAGFLSDRCYSYAYEGSVGKLRFKRLPQIIRSMWFMSNEYQTYHEYMWNIAKERDCHPNQLHDMREWPEIKW